jgi:hypothetical protein
LQGFNLESLNVGQHSVVSLDLPAIHHAQFIVAQFTAHNSPRNNSSPAQFTAHNSPRKIDIPLDEFLILPDYC